MKQKIDLKLVPSETTVLYGSIDENGNIVVPFIYSHFYKDAFDNKLIAVVRQGLYGFINQKGEEVIECQFDAVNFLDYLTQESK